MTQDEIIEMWNSVIKYAPSEVRLEAFSKLIAAKEREACAKVADQISNKYGYGYYGNEVDTAVDTADEIATAIRARGEA
jgi:hypothetical protein